MQSDGRPLKINEGGGENSNRASLKTKPPKRSSPFNYPYSLEKIYRTKCSVVEVLFSRSEIFAVCQNRRVVHTRVAPTTSARTLLAVIYTMQKKIWFYDLVEWHKNGTFVLRPRTGSLCGLTRLSAPSFSETRGCPTRAPRSCLRFANAGLTGEWGPGPRPY